MIEEVKKERQLIIKIFEDKVLSNVERMNQDGMVDQLHGYFQRIVQAIEQSKVFIDVQALFK